MEQGTLRYILAHPLAISHTLSHDADPLALYLDTLTTRESRRAALSQLNGIAGLLTGGVCRASTLAWHLLRRHHLIQLRQTVSDRYALHTGNRMLSLVKGVCREASNLRLMAGDDLLSILSVPGLRGETLPAGRAMAATEVAQLLRACPDTARGRRDACIVALLFGTGMRRAELAALQLRDVDRTTWTIAIREGKGRKDRLVYLEDSRLRACVERWIATRGAQVGPLLASINKAGRIALGLSGARISKALAALEERAKVAHASPHDFRRTAATLMLDGGGDIEAVSRVLGHKHLATTQRYVRRGEDSKRRAAAHLTLPTTDKGGS